MLFWFEFFIWKLKLRNWCLLAHLKGLFLIFLTLTMSMSTVRGEGTYFQAVLYICVCLAILRMDHTVRIYFPCHLSICEKWIFFLPQQNRKVTYQSIYQATHLCIGPTKELPLCGTNYLSAKLISVYLACLISTYVIQFSIYN